jgi:hypothetical protein
MPDLRRVLAEKGQKACPQVIRAIIRAAGYSWRKARKVLTSTDPQYQEKLTKIQSILSTLGPNERFFSIDRYFAERNAFFKANPKQAGKIIWGKETTPSTFSPAHNCKYRNRFFYGL